MVEGWLEFHAADGTAFISGDKTRLCRCGASKSKPFCDGSHKAIGFTA
jgi:CDGSH-type Zn-finger protein